MDIMILTICLFLKEKYRLIIIRQILLYHLFYSLILYQSLTLLLLILIFIIIINPEKSLSGFIILQNSNKILALNFYTYNIVTKDEYCVFSHTKADLLG